jgi:hypothetical protein
MVPAYMGAPVSLAFQGECSKLFSRRECGSPSSCVCWEAGLTTKHAEKWSLEPQGNVGGVGELLSVSCSSHYSYGYLLVYLQIWRGRHFSLVMISQG